MVSRTAEGLAVVDRPAATVWYGPNTSEAWQALVTFSGEGAYGRQRQRSCRDLADHARGDGEGVQLLRQPSDGIAGILQGDEPGRRRVGGRAKAARRADGEIPAGDEPAEPGADGRHGRAAAVDRRPAQRDQGDAASGASQLAGAGRRSWHAAAAAHQTSANGG